MSPPIDHAIERGVTNTDLIEIGLINTFPRRMCLTSGSAARMPLITARVDTPAGAADRHQAPRALHHRHEFVCT